MKACNCVGVGHVCAESWEFMRVEHGMTHEELEEMLAPLRVRQAEIARLLEERCTR